MRSRRWCTTFYTREWWNQYIDTPEAYTKWRNTFGSTTSTCRMRAICTTGSALDRGWVGDTPGFAMTSSSAGLDQGEDSVHLQPAGRIFTPECIEAQVKMIPNARGLAIDSNAGHLICCNADPHATRKKWATASARFWTS